VRQVVSSVFSCHMYQEQHPLIFIAVHGLTWPKTWQCCGKGFVFTAGLFLCKQMS
jgi:hypothetical protein